MNMTTMAAGFSVAAWLPHESPEGHERQNHANQDHQRIAGDFQFIGNTGCLSQSYTQQQDKNFDDADGADPLHQG